MGVALASLVVTLLPASGVAAATTRATAKSPMPAALAPGTATKAVFPERSVPAYVTPTRIRSRVRAGNGGADGTYRVPTPVGSSTVWGDWDGNGFSDVGVFRVDLRWYLDEGARGWWTKTHIEVNGSADHQLHQSQITHGPSWLFGL